MRHASASVLVAPLAILALLGPALIGSDRLGFRDVSHFYTPLYEYVAQRCASQWVPLWNPLDHTGIPLAGDTTTAVFYPVRYLVFLLPISVDAAMAWYVALHLILASLTAWTAARWSGVSAVAASIGSVAYVLSGSVLFLYSNPPFLVGAAWLPLVLGSQLCHEGPPQRMRTLITSTSLAMMVLGGDPQTALHAMLIVAVVWFVRRASGKPSPLNFRGLLMGPLVAAVLAAPQIAASLDWSRQSDRVRQNESFDSWFSPPIVGSQRHQAFEYSLPPWHAIEIVAPNVFGSPFPSNQRLSRLLPGDGRMWTPSIYMGMLVAMACAVRLWRWRSDGIDTWMAIAMLSLALAMGHFGVVWWLQATTGLLTSVDSAAGGPYWFAYHIVPGYDSFRYPAKWLSVFALALAMTTARFLDQETSRERFRKMALPTLFILIIAAITTWLGSSAFSLIHENASNSSVKDEFWGPLQTEAASTQTTLALVHSCIVVTILTWLIRRTPSATWSTERLMWALLIVIVLDTGIAARNMILRIPRATERQLINDYDSTADSQVQRWMRTKSGRGWPRVWAETRSDQRALEVEASGRAAWYGRWHLPDHQAVFNNMVSIRSHDVAIFWQAAQSLTKNMTGQEQRQFWDAMRQWLGIDGVLHTSDRSNDVSLRKRRYQLVDRLIRTKHGDDAIQIHHWWNVVDWASPDLSTVKARLLEIAAAGGNPVPLVSVPENSAIPLPTLAEPSVPEQVRITAGEQDEEHSGFDVVLGSPSLLTRRVYQDGNWSASYRTDGSDVWIEAEVHRVDFLTQGVVLPTGTHELRFRYQPWWLHGTLVIALVGWIGIVAYLPMQKRLKTRSRMSSV